MAIQLIDNFYINSEKPLDTRFVVGPSNFYGDRNDITHKYEGLRVWDLNDNSPFVWDGTQWINENTLGISGTGAVNYVSKFNSVNSITDSQIFDDGINVGIGTTLASNKLSVVGNVSATGFFIGNGSQIITLNINSSNVTGKIGFNNLPNGTNEQILQSTGTSTLWVAQNTLSVGSATIAVTATNATNATILQTSVSSDHYLLFSTGIGNTPVRTTTSNNSIIINPSNGRVRINGNVGIGVAASTSNKLTVFGNVSIGSTTAASSNGLRVQGETLLGNKTRISASGTNDAITPGSLTIGFNSLNTNIKFDAFGDSSVAYFRNPSTTKRFQIFQSTSTSLNTSNNLMFIHTNNGDPQFSGGRIEFGGSDVGTTGNKIVMYNQGSYDVEGDWGLLIGAGSTGNIKIGGDAFKPGGGVWSTPSDERLKKDIKNFSDGLEKIMNLNPVYYKFKDVSFNDKEYIGFIAQDLEQITPYMVSVRNSNGLEDCRILDDSALTKILVNSVKEQQVIINDLKTRIENLES